MCIPCTLHLDCISRGVTLLSLGRHTLHLDCISRGVTLLSLGRHTLHLDCISRGVTLLSLGRQMLPMMYTANVVAKRKQLFHVGQHFMLHLFINDTGTSRNSLCNTGHLPNTQGFKVRQHTYIHTETGSCKQTSIVTISSNYPSSRY